jgi:hypothetical protein
MLENHWELANGRTKTVQIVLPQSKEKKHWQKFMENHQEETLGQQET